MTVAPQFEVVVNDEGQYSVWPASAPPPPGWHPASPAAPCDYVAPLRGDRSYPPSPTIYPHQGK